MLLYAISTRNNITLNVDGCSRAVLNKMHIYKFILCPLVVSICMHRTTTTAAAAATVCDVSLFGPSPSHQLRHTVHRLYIVLLIIPTANFVYCINLLENIQGGLSQPKAPNTAQNASVSLSAWLTHLEKYAK